MYNIHSDFIQTSVHLSVPTFEMYVFYLDFNLVTFLYVQKLLEMGLQHEQLNTFQTASSSYNYDHNHVSRGQKVKVSVSNYKI